MVLGTLLCSLLGTVVGLEGGEFGLHENYPLQKADQEGRRKQNDKSRMHCFAHLRKRRERLSC